MTGKIPFEELKNEGTIVIRLVMGDLPAVREDGQLSQMQALCSLMKESWAINPHERPNVGKYLEGISWMVRLCDSLQSAHH